MARALDLSPTKTVHGVLKYLVMFCEAPSVKARSMSEQVRADGSREQVKQHCHVKLFSKEQTMASVCHNVIVQHFRSYKVLRGAQTGI